MDLFKLLKGVEDRIESMFKPRAEGDRPSRARVQDPLELKQAILSALEGEIRRVDGKPTFPFNAIDVELFAPDARAEAILASELLDGNRLREELLRTLEAARVTPDRRLTLRVRCVGESPDTPDELRQRGYRLICAREQDTEKLTASGLPKARLTVESGEANLTELKLERPRLNLGRLGEVVDDAQRVVRRNDLAFADSGGVNASVSRIHAHVGFDRESGEWRIFDDNSAEGTLVIRDGRRIAVAQGQRRGVALRDGDELYLGQVRLRFVKD